jgi:hypothetical protein
MHDVAVPSPRDSYSPRQSLCTSEPCVTNHLVPINPPHWEQQDLAIASASSPNLGLLEGGELCAATNACGRRHGGVGSQLAFHVTTADRKWD